MSWIFVIEKDFTMLTFLLLQNRMYSISSSCLSAWTGEAGCPQPVKFVKPRQRRAGLNSIRKKQALLDAISECVNESTSYEQFRFLLFSRYQIKVKESCGESATCCRIGKNRFTAGRLVPLMRKKQFCIGLNRTLLTGRTEKPQNLSGPHRKRRSYR